MNKLILLAGITMLSCGIITESRAACNLTNNDGDIVDESGNYCGTCGVNCNWKIENGTMKISGGANGEIGTMDDYYVTDDGKIGNTPWWNYNSLIKSVDVKGVKNIGVASFKEISGVTGVHIAEGITEVGEAAFYGTSISSLYIPDSVKEIKWAAFLTPLTQISLPDTVTGLSERVFGDYLDGKIICRGTDESCINITSQLEDYTYYNHTGFFWGKMSIANSVSSANEEQCSGSNHYWSGRSCNNKKNGINCAENWKQNEDFCNRIQYTPAEAAKVLKDDNTNEVTITFRK